MKFHSRKNLDSCSTCFRLGLGLFLGLLLSSSWPATVAWAKVPSQETVPKETPRAEADTTVELDVDHPLLFETNEPGFRIFVRGWEPNGEVAVYAVGSKGEQVGIVAVEKKARVSAEGEATSDVPYELQGLHPGHWMVVVAGKPEAHGFRLKIPKVKRTSPDPKAWEMDFDAADRYEKEVGTSEN